MRMAPPSVMHLTWRWRRCCSGLWQPVACLVVAPNCAGVQQSFLHAVSRPGKVPAQPQGSRGQSVRCHAAPTTQQAGCLPPTLRRAPACHSKNPAHGIGSNFRSTTLELPASACAYAVNTQNGASEVGVTPAYVLACCDPRGILPAAYTCGQSGWSAAAVARHAGLCKA